MTNFLHTLWPFLTAAVSLLITLAASAHAIIYKRDSRSAVGWVALIWLVPIIGALLYVTLGINRIRRKAVSLRGPERYAKQPDDAPIRRSEELEQHWAPERRHFIPLSQLCGRVSERELLAGNDITPLCNGDEAYPVMLEAIDRAQTSIGLTTYIFDYDRAGKRFVETLARAVERGVEVRVLIDAVGARYSFPSIVHLLRRSGIRTALFMPTYVPWSTPYVNLRSHRKILTIDGNTAFTGGMNIREGNLLSENPKHPVQDIHTRVTGPVVRELQEVFAYDWHFATRESLKGDTWFPSLESTGKMIARVITDGPDRDYDKMRFVLIGALSAARHSVRIATPYFIPDLSLISALNTAAMRGVTVDIVLPGKNNLRAVHWACMAQLWQVLEWGCRVWLSPPPFDHSKIFVVDDAWSLIGTANWDARSLRLNFEIAVEAYDTVLAGRMVELFEQKRRNARRITHDDVNARPLPVQLRDGIARLFAPYL